MAIPVVTTGADITDYASALPRLCSLTAEATGTPLEYEWTLLNVPAGSTDNVGVNGDFVDGVSAVQNPSLTVTNYGAAYVAQCRARNAEGWSDPELDGAAGQQVIAIRDPKFNLTFPGAGQKAYAATLDPTLKAFNDFLANLRDREVNSLDHAGLPAMLTAIGSDERVLRLASASALSVADNTTIPANVLLAAAKGGRLNIASGKVLTIGGELLAGAHQIFEGSGKVQGTFRSNYVLPEWWGAKGDAVKGTPGSGTDDTVAFLKALLHCCEAGKTLYLQPGRWYNIRQNPCVFGAANIVGGGNCGIIFDTDFRSAIGVGYEGFYFNIGIEALPTSLDGAHKATANSFTGVLYNFTIKMRSAAGPDDTNGRHVVQIHNASREWLMDRVHVDLTELDPAAFVCSLAALDSSSVWASASVKKDGTIMRCEHAMASTANATAEGHDGQGGFNLVQCTNVRMLYNAVDYCGDDALMFVTCTGCVAIGNRLRTTHGRVGMLSGKDCIFIGNYLERAYGANSAWFAGDIFLAQLDAVGGMPAIGAVVIGNEIYVPNGPTGTVTQINMSAARDFIVANNLLRSDAAGATVNAIKIETFNAGAGWNDTTDLDDDVLNSTKYAKPRNGLVSGNMVRGTNPGGIVESCPSEATIEGPIHYESNEAASYNVFGGNSTFAASNRIYARTPTYPVSKIQGADYRYLAGVAVIDPVPIAVFEAHEIRVGQTIAARLRNGDTKKYLLGGGILLYWEVEANPAPVNAGITFKLKKNGSQVLADLSLAAAAVQASVDARDRTDRTYASGDYLEVDAVGATAMQSIVDATITIYAMRARPT
jgi:hypothetical protein